ncbi:YciI family protein [Roseomonas gilardii subsp. gilardii]|uniref:YciI family protein n=1 Tax=Roseomonas gilardii TaxID=257708 RepID=UPI001FFAC81D|nr:YciI family protein [Roseomonas gilardii]UPG73248.1 YciI family protein [Roseomonas gilardii subsp. gilardii]
MPFMVLAYDGKDAEAPARRKAARPAHLARVAQEAESGRLLIGGPLTDADGRMIGSMMVLDLPDETAVHAWLAEDPYVRQDVWKDISILPFQIAPLKYRPLPGG